ncbi:hypothetical protein [Thiolinea disciformis]|uniref:hypothetical protein n=1 Tax=Thiolinea disciformis TaxID=125614 RepID=UPI00038124E2|nr:hypothetical protein [Thiolinea disciformis]
MYMPNNWGALPNYAWNNPWYNQLPDFGLGANNWLGNDTQVVGDEWTRGQDVESNRRWGETTVLGSPYPWGGPVGIAETNGYSQTRTSEQVSVGMNHMIGDNLANIW